MILKYVIHYVKYVKMELLGYFQKELINLKNKYKQDKMNIINQFVDFIFD